MYAERSVCRCMYVCMVAKSVMGPKRRVGCVSVGGRSLPQQVANAINVGAAVVRGRLPPSLFFSFSLQAVGLCVNGGAGDAMIASFPDTSRHGER